MTFLNVELELDGGAEPTDGVELAVHLVLLLLLRKIKDAQEPGSGLQRYPHVIGVNKTRDMIEIGKCKPRPQPRETTPTAV